MQHRIVDTRTEVTFCLNLEASFFYFTVYGIKRLLKKIDVVVKWDYTPAVAEWSCVEVVS